MMTEKNQDSTKRFWRHTPNFITGLRIGLAVTFPFMPSTFHWGLLIGALATEFLDGFLARSFSWVSPLGKLLDPFADKLFFFSVGLTWLLKSSLSLSHLLLLGTRELGILIVALIFIFRRKAYLLRPLPARFLGKVTTTLQYVAFFIYLWQGEIVPVILFLTAAIGLASAVQYMLILRSPLRGRD